MCYVSIDQKYAFCIYPSIFHSPRVNVFSMYRFVLGHLSALITHCDNLEFNLQDFFAMDAAMLTFLPWTLQCWIRRSYLPAQTKTLISRKDTKWQRCFLSLNCRATYFPCVLWMTLSYVQLQTETPACGKNFNYTLHLAHMTHILNLRLAQGTKLKERRRRTTITCPRRPQKTWTSRLRWHAQTRTNIRQREWLIP